MSGLPSSWDVIVIGAGVAGLAAATAAARGGFRCLCLDRMGPGGLLINLGPLTDCPDLPAGTTGPDHVASLTERALEAGVELGIGEVQALHPGDTWSVVTEEGGHTARAVIIATGLGNGRLGIGDVTRFEGQGLSHCAACDGPLYAGETVVVAGADRWTVQEAIELSHVAGHVTLVTAGAAADTAALAGLGNVAVLPARIVALDGEDGLQTVVVEQDGQRTALPARAVFAYADRRPELGFAEGLVACDADARIRVDESLRAGASLLFAAGDVRAGAVQSVAHAEADGQRAGEAVLRALAS